MSNSFFYKGNVTLADDNEFTMTDLKLDYDASYFVKNWLESETVQGLIHGESVTLTGNSIAVTTKETNNLPKLSKAIDIANRILQKSFQMECDDEYGLHRSVVADSIKIYPCKSIYNTINSFEIRFDLIARLIEIPTKKLVNKINRKGFVELTTSKLMEFLNFFKLEYDNPSKYKITKIQRTYWIQQSKQDFPKGWDYYASQIWNSTQENDTVFRLMQLSCPNPELRKKLQTIDSPNDRILKSYSDDLMSDAVNIEALEKISELKNEKSSPEQTNIEARVGSYIVQQIRSCPKKFLNSKYTAIRNCADEVSSLLSTKKYR